MATFHIVDLPEDCRIFDNDIVRELVVSDFFSSSRIHQDLIRVGKYKEAEMFASELPVLVSSAIVDGVMSICDEWDDDSGVMGVACGIHDDVFYFSSSFDFLDDYLRAKDINRIIADVSIGVLNLIYDDNGFNRDEGIYILSCLREHSKNLNIEKTSSDSKIHQNKSRGVSR